MSEIGRVRLASLYKFKLVDRANLSKNLIRPRVYFAYA